MFRVIVGGLKNRFGIVGFIVGVVVLVGVVILAPLITQWFWKVAIVPPTGFKELSYWQAFLLSVWQVLVVGRRWRR